MTIGTLALQMEFLIAECDKRKDYPVTNSGPIGLFGADNMALDLKDLRKSEFSRHLTLILQEQKDLKKQYRWHSEIDSNVS